MEEMPIGDVIKLNEKGAANLHFAKHLYKPDELLSSRNSVNEQRSTATDFARQVFDEFRALRICQKCSSADCGDLETFNFINAKTANGNETERSESAQNCLCLPLIKCH